MTAMNLHRYPSPSGGFALGKMGVGAKLMRQGKTAKDYVQSGLVAMWDGIENAGWGTHDASATTWRDLIGTANQSVYGGDGWLDDGYSWANDTGVYRMFDCGNVFNTGIFTLDVVVSRNSSYGANFPGINGVGGGASEIGIRSWDSYSRVGFWAYGSRFADVSANANVKHMTLTCDSTTITAYWDAENRGTIAYDSSVALDGLLYWQRGILYACRIYSRALTAAEIAANYAIDKERFNLP